MNKYKLNHFLKFNSLKLLHPSKHNFIMLITVFAFLFLASSAMSAIYYIDYASGNDGNNGISKSSPWKRCPGMNGFAGSYAHSAGDKFIFKGGVTWPTTCFDMTISNSGTSEAQDEYTVDETWYTGGLYSAPVWDGENLHYHANTYLIYGQNLAYITFNGIKIINVGQSGNRYGGVFKANPMGNGLIFSNVEIIGYCGHGFILVYNRGITTGPKIQNCKLSHLTNHIEIGNSGTVTDHVCNIEISGCEFFDPHTQLVGGDHGDGLHFWNTDDNYVFENLKIFGNKFYGDWGGSDASTTCTSQIYIESCGYSVKIYNNHNTFSNSTAVRENYLFSPGVYTVSASSSLEIYNNTICCSKMAERPAGWDSGASYGAAAGILARGTPGSTVKIMGNIITHAKKGIYLTGYDTITCDYNMVQIRSDGQYGLDLSTYCSTLAAWQARGFGNNSVSGDPLFTDIVNTPLDLTLQEGSLAIDLYPTAKAPIDDFTTDRLGNIRPQGSEWDVGAYEGTSLTPRSPSNLRLTTN